MGSQLLRRLSLAALPLLMLAAGGCEQKTDLSQEKSPNAPAQTVKTPPGAGSQKPGSGFQTKPIGSDTSLKVVQ